MLGIGSARLSLHVDTQDAAEARGPAARAEGFIFRVPHRRPSASRRLARRLIRSMGRKVDCGPEDLAIRSAARRDSPREKFEGRSPFKEEDSKDCCRGREEL